MKNTRIQLRRLLSSKKYVFAPGAYDCLSAKVIESTGFEAITMSHTGKHGVILGQPDTGLLDINEVTTNLKNVCNAVNIPVIGDAEGGFGNALNVVRTIRQFEQAGCAGVFLKDQQQPTTCAYVRSPEVITAREMVGKIHAALDARTDEDMILIARTDAPYEEALERVEMYLEAGADMVKITPKTHEQLVEIPKKVNGQLHLGMLPHTGIADGLNAKDFGELGYKIVSYPVSCLLAHTAAIMDYFRYLKEHDTDEGFPGNFIEFNDYLDFIGVEDIKKASLKYGLDKV
ncbi:MAG: isocitrate lyase/PEP mutase family protein [Clostridium sp.]|nr:isocitrate lyase/PEP mutase family protein [Clostridium sp.]